MPQAIHESTAFNSRNRKVAIHCVFSVKDNTHIGAPVLSSLQTVFARLSGVVAVAYVGGFAYGLAVCE